MIIIDSDVLISFLNGRPWAAAAMELLDASSEELATTSLNAAEVLRGTPEGGRQRVAAERLLSALVEVPFGPRAVRRYANVMTNADRVGAPLPVLDTMVACIALEAGARIATRNVRHFGRIAGIELVSV